MNVESVEYQVERVREELKDRPPLDSAERAALRQLRNKMTEVLKEMDYLLIYGR